LSLAPSVMRSRLSKIELLRKLDSTLDFSRSTVQLELILYMGFKGTHIRPKRVAGELGISAKSVYDALSKLMGKGLVKRTSLGSYTLTKAGLEFVRELENIFSTYSEGATPQPPSRVSLGSLSISHSLVLYKYVYESILAIGSSPRKELSLKELARLLRVRESTLIDYLELVTSRRGRVGLLRRVVRSLGNGRGEVYYRLTDFGFQELSRLAEYRRFRSNRFLHGLMLLTNSLTINDSVRRGALLTLVLMGASLVGFAVGGPIIGFTLGLVSILSGALLYVSLSGA